MGKKHKSNPKGVAQGDIVARNRKARFDFFIESTFEAGLVLVGSEVKSIRQGRVSLKEAYVRLEGGEAFLVGAHVAEWPYAAMQNHVPTRPRKLLVHKHELRRLHGRVAERGYTLVPLCLYLKRGRIKLEVGLARGKRKYDKRETLRKKDQKREEEQALDR